MKEDKYPKMKGRENPNFLKEEKYNIRFFLNLELLTNPLKIAIPEGGSGLTRYSA